MKLFDGIRRKAGRYLLLRDMARVKRRRQVFNFAAARSIGILFKVDPEGSDEDQALLKKYARYLKEEQKRFLLLGYVDSNTVPDRFKDSLEFSYICRKDLNWCMQPISGKALNFLKNDFDVLIDLCVCENFPLLYICGLSDARFKIGPMGDGREAHYDMMIRMEGESSPKQLLKQVDHYLNVINR